MDEDQDGILMAEMDVALTPDGSMIVGPSGSPGCILIPKALLEHMGIRSEHITNVHVVSGVFPMGTLDYLVDIEYEVEGVQVIRMSDPTEISLFEGNHEN